MPKRILGVDRALMMLCRVARKYWRFYSPVRDQIAKASFCVECNRKVKYVEVDHNPRIGSRPRTIEEFPAWWNKMMFGPQQGLCKPHHSAKTKKERKPNE